MAQLVANAGKGQYEVMADQLFNDYGKKKGDHITWPEIAEENKEECPEGSDCYKEGKELFESIAGEDNQISHAELATFLKKEFS